jgi:hypothetical protein
MKSKSNGYVLVLALMILSVLIFIVTRMFYNSSSHTAFTYTVINREKAKQLALSGVQLAIGRLSIPEKTEEKDSKISPISKANQKKDTEDPNKILLERILPTINRWETITLKETVDGIVSQR